MTKSLPTTSFGFPTAALNFLKVKDSLWSMVPTAHVVPNGLFVLSAELSFDILYILYLFELYIEYINISNWKNQKKNIAIYLKNLLIQL